MLNKERLFDEDEMLELMRERFLSSLVSRENYYKQRFKEICFYLKLNPYFNFPALALLEPARSSGEEWEKRKALKEIRDYLQRYEHGAGSIVIFTDSEERLGLLFSWVSRELIESINSKLNGVMPHPVHIGVGRPCSNLADVHLSYRQALAALQDKFYKSDGEVVYYNELIRYQPVGKYPVEKEKELLEFLKHAPSSGEIECAVERFYTHILQYGPVDSKSIYELTIRLLLGLEKRILTDLENVNVYKPCESTAVVQMKSMRQIKAYVTEQLSALREVLLQNEGESHRNIIKKTIQYMEQECQNATLYSVAQKVYMTPTYLSSLFKMNTGKTFIDQLTEIRITKAKEMLKCTHLKNYEVAEKVGYKDSRYFSQIFKKKVGLSPSEYRDSAQ
ncbi:helix-turn-helix domain-containing protein [Paenibacillus sp. NPDC056579]|uniref:helix-turn-helix domain-containing protein n=1 Tax=unclassified Paenibacillus TaxID=185978 RepID=UPI001EF978DC|nr:helix-turn-helix domain-containing protein [Paenibacillus sp. H1-7]ULL16098.1 AraC family transcriptional regulator [Paenibacillus sp. H1-7]